MEYATREALTECLKHRLHNAGNATLMSDELITMLSEHAIRNYRVLFGMAAELLSSAVQQELTHLDEKLYFQCFSASSAMKKTKEK